jgi:hypothetical protein
MRPSSQFVEDCCICVNLQQCRCTSHRFLIGTSVTLKFDFGFVAPPQTNSNITHIASCRTWEEARLSAAVCCFCSRCLTSFTIRHICVVHMMCVWLHVLDYYLALRQRYAHRVVTPMHAWYGFRLALLFGCWLQRGRSNTVPLVCVCVCRMYWPAIFMHLRNLA